MSPKKPKDEGSGQPAAQPVDGADPSRLAFTSAIVAALKDLDTRKAPSSAELGQRAYAKLQYDLPLVSVEELQGLAETLRSSLQLKSGEPPLALTSKLLENVADRGQLCSAYRALCAALFVDLVSHCLVLPEQDTWVLLHAVSYVLLEDEELWGDGRLMGGVFQLLRALGAHRHAQELQPLLHAYVGLLADRLAAAPAEIACLDSLWDALTAASARSRLWQQRPGNADLSTALKGTGVLGSLCRLLAAAADLPGGESLRGAALGIAASSMRPKEGTVRRAGSVAASVRFSGVHYQEIAADPTDHLEGVGPMRGRSPQGVKKNIFKKYFDEFNTYALMVSPVSPSRAPPAFRSGGGGSVASAPATPTSRRSLGGGAGAGLIVRAGSIARGGGGGAVGEWDAPWTPISAAGVSTTHVPSEWDSPRPRWAVGRRKGMGAAGGAAEPGDGPLHAATRPVTCGGPLPSHVAALDELLAKSWSRAEVEAAQASLCLLGLLWRATAAGDSHARAHLLNSSALLTALTTRVAEGDFDAMFAAREVAADQRGAVALEKAGALRAVCGALRKLVAAARAAAGEAEGEGAAGTDGEEEPGGAAARAAGAGPAKSPAAKSPAAKSPGKKQLALAGAGKGAGGGVRAPPGLTGRSPSPSKKAVVVSVEGVTEGGEETERAAAGVLPDPDPEKEKGKEQDEQKADTDKGKDQDQERGDEAAKRMSEGRRRQLQLQEALLRCLHTLAACGMGKEPQEAVQRALRDAGAPAMERLARVLQEHHTLAGCSSAAYLLWLAAAGDYSATPAAELNVLRSRLAAEAPKQPEDRSSTSGFGVVGADLVPGDSPFTSRGAASSGGGAGGEIGGGGSRREVTGPSLGLAALRVASAALMLTPRESRPGSGGHMISPQDMDLSNIIDSSVELTGKEYIMQAIQAAGALAAQEVPRPAAGEGGAEGGAEAVGGILPFAAALLETAADAPESLAAAAVSGSSTELRLQLFALMGNIALHSDGVEALTSEAAGAPPGLVAALFAAARESLALVGSSPTGWREGQRLLEACFTVLTNLHRGRATLSPPPDPATGRPQEAYALALRALAMQLPGAMGAADRVRVRAAAARMLDSAIAAYEGVGGSAPPAVAEELMALVAAGGGIATASAGASITAADGSALGLVSCLARSPLVARRLWTTPLVPAVMKAHARARKAGEGEVEEAARGVCQQLLRACHREDRGSVSDADRRVDRWGLTERMLSQLKCRLEWDGGEEAIMLVDWDAD
eukprot:XP_001702867.1 predicted protein [Chlamydomonas reinhardtii]